MLRHTLEMHIEHYNRTVGEQHEQESAVREAQAIINGQKDIADDLPH